MKSKSQGYRIKQYIYVWSHLNIYTICKYVLSSGFYMKEKQIFYQDCIICQN